MCAQTFNWRDESPFMYAAAPNGRVGVGVDERGLVAWALEIDEDRWGSGRAVGVWGCGWAMTGVGAATGDGSRSWLCPCEWWW